MNMLLKTLVFATLIGVVLCEGCATIASNCPKPCQIKNAEGCLECNCTTPENCPDSPVVCDKGCHLVMTAGCPGCECPDPEEASHGSTTPLVLIPVSIPALPRSHLGLPHLPHFPNRHHGHHVTLPVGGASSIPPFSVPPFSVQPFSGSPFSSTPVFLSSTPFVSSTPLVSVTPTGATILPGGNIPVFHHHSTIPGFTGPTSFTGPTTTFSPDFSTLSGHVTTFRPIDGSSTTFESTTGLPVTSTHHASTTTKKSWFNIF